MQDNDILEQRQEERQEPPVAESAEKAEKLSLRAVLQQLPPTLMTQTLKRFGSAALMVALITIMALLAKDWHYCLGYIVALFAAYSGMDIIWKYGEGKIHAVRMVLCKAYRQVLRKNQIVIILRDASVSNLTTQEFETYKYSIEVPAREQPMLTPGTVLNVYICETAPNNILAYEILGEMGN